VYEKPLSVYTASLFDEVNLIPKEWLNSEKDLILYPHQLKISENGFKVEVQQSFFQGADFLIIAQKDGKQVFFKSKQAISSKKQLFLNVFPENLALRN